MYTQGNPVENQTALHWNLISRNMAARTPVPSPSSILATRSSPLSVKNKLQLYKTVVAPIWSYGLELRGCASKSNIAIIQQCQSKILTAIVDAPRYVTNAMIHNDLGIPPVQEAIHDRSSKHRPNYNPI
jgi:hypothetical protein